MNVLVDELVRQFTVTVRRFNLMLEEFHRGDIHIEKHQSGGDGVRKSAYFIQRYNR